MTRISLTAPEFSSFQSRIASKFSSAKWPRGFALLALLTALATSALGSDLGPAKIRRYAIDPYRSYLSFAIGFMKVRTEDGSFHDYSGTILLDEDDISSSSVTAAIMAESIFTGVRARDRHLRGPDFFDVEKHPIILFRSSDIGKVGESLVLRGDLTMHGQTRRIEIPVTLFKQDGEAGDRKLHIQGHVMLLRHDYGIIGNFWGDKVLSDEVQIELNIEAEQLRVPRPEMADAMQKHDLESVLEPTVEARGVEAATIQYQELRHQAASQYDFSPPALLRVAERLGDAGKIEEALGLVQYNLQMFPKDETSWDQLGWLRFVQGDVTGSITAYRQLLAINSHNTNALEMLRWLGKQPAATRAESRQ